MNQDHLISRRHFIATTGVVAGGTLINPDSRRATPSDQADDSHTFSIGMEVLKNVYQVGGSLSGITHTTGDANYDDCNTYVLKTPKGLIMLDCGCGDTLEQIFGNMSYYGLNPSDIKACLITHPHLDHAGAAYLLKKRGVALYAGKSTADAIQSGDERCCGFLYHKEFKPCTVDHIVADGEVTDVLGLKIKAMLLPGHTAGCTIYMFDHDGKRIVLSGDVIGTLLAGFFGWSGSVDFNKTAYIESLKRFAKLDFDVMLVGHGLICYHQPKRRIEEVLNQALMQWR